MLKNGMRFECQMSGNCCLSRGAYGYVYLTKKDIKRFCDYLKLTKDQFFEQHCDETDGYWHLKNPDQDCHFLKNKKCSVYEGRPTQCRTWPFWPENMNPKAWTNEIASFCPGVGKGKQYKESEIKKILHEHRFDG